MKCRGDARSSRITRLLATAIALLLLVAACGSPEDDGGVQEPEPAEDVEDAAAPEEPEEPEEPEADEDADSEVDADDDVAEFFSGTTMTFIVPYGAGAGFDAYGRLIARHLAEELGANVAVENRPGAGGIVGMNDLAAAEGDGLTIGITTLGQMVASTLQEEEGIRFDLEEFAWLGNLAPSELVWITGAASGLESVEDAAAAGSHSFGQTGVAAAIHARVVAEALGIEGDYVLGFEHAGEYEIAIIRGDVQGSVSSLPTHLPAIENGDLNALLFLGSERSPLIPDAPSVADLDLPSDSRELLEVHINLQELFRVIVAPPGVPPERVEHLRAALERVVADPDVQADFEQQGLLLDFSGGAEIDEVLPTLLEPPAVYRELLAEDDA